MEGPATCFGHEVIVTRNAFQDVGTLSLFQIRDSSEEANSYDDFSTL